MKLPSINKPSSASSNRQLPPRQSNNAISNLEKNLFAKLNEYDEQNKIESKKVQNTSKMVTTTEEVSDRKEYKDQLIKKQHSLSNQSQTQKVKDLKSSQKQQPQETLFLTHNQQVKSEESNSDNQESDSDSSVEDLLQRSRIMDKQKRVMLNYEDNSDVGQLNKMICQTDIDINEQFQSICLMKKTLTTMNESMKEVGFGINQKLLDDLNRQYEEMIRLQKESQAIEEFQMREQQHKSKMPAVRSGSVNQQKKQKK